MAPGEVRGSCSIADVAPTLLELAGLPVPRGLDGRSLLPLASGAVPGRPVVARAEGALPGRAAAGPTLRLTSVRTEHAKALLVRDPRTRAVLVEELYDLVADPGETTPLPLRDLDRFGIAFVRAVATLRAEPSFAPPAAAGADVGQ
jgi:arylsulfatase A-like enzyme